MRIKNPLLSRCASAILPWRSDLGTLPFKSGDFPLAFPLKTRACFKNLQNYHQFEVKGPVDEIRCSVDCARYVKLALGTIFLLAGALLLILGAQNPILFYTGIGCLGTGAIWFLCLAARNQTTGRGLPSCLPKIGGGRLSDVIRIMRSNATLLSGKNPQRTL